MIKNSSTVVFLCGSRDFHAMDWYKSAKLFYKACPPIIITDTIESEGFCRLITHSDRILPLFIIDIFLFPRPSYLGHLWRNLVKLFFFPLQVLRLRFLLRSRNIKYIYSHSMYYTALSFFSGLPYIATPQGSEILVRPFKSHFYKFFSSLFLSSASLITVDSSQMSDIITRLYGLKSYIIQNGIDTSQALHTASLFHEKSHYATSIHCFKKNQILSFRGFSSLYRIDSILHAFNSLSNESFCLDIVYPFYDQLYLDSVRSSVDLSNVSLLGRLTRTQLYESFASCVLAVSIPSSDSSPRSVYEAIFCGAVVAVTPNHYVDDLPWSMRSRIVTVDLCNPHWMSDALDLATSIALSPFVPCTDALTRFDQYHSFCSLDAKVNNLLHR